MSSRVKAPKPKPAKCKICEGPIPVGWRTYCSSECLTAKRGGK